MKRLLPLLLTLACSRSEAPPADLGHISVGAPVVRTDTVGVGGDARAATFVLVDATNTANRELDVTLAGDLTDASGAVVGHLRMESLRIGAGASRTFALVDDDNAAVAGATGATIAVRGAAAPSAGRDFLLGDGHAFDDHGKVMVAANLTNHGDRRGQVLVLASFHDASGAPMKRPFDVVTLDAGETKVVRFEGPDGSKTGAIYLGQETF